jgi:hypothetical protein
MSGRTGLMTHPLLRFCFAFASLLLRLSINKRPDVNEYCFFIRVSKICSIYYVRSSLRKLVYSH